jgi:uncharacterized membrane protein
VYVFVKAYGGDPFFIIAGITGVSTVLLYWAYGVCIYLGVRGNQDWRKEQVWNLGRWSVPVAWIAIAWIVFMSPLFLWIVPSYNPAALPTVIGFLLFLMVYYYGWARKRFAGPKVQGGESELTEIEREFEHAAGEVHAPATA